MRPLLLIAFASLAWGSDCSRTSVGFTPLTDPDPPVYKGQPLGLYPEGNVRPAAHEKLGLSLAAQVIPRNAAGQADPNGKVVFLSVGMSNTTQEFTAFLALAKADPLRNPRVQAVDGAIGGKTAALIAGQPDQYWPEVDRRIEAAQVSAAQVQVVWLKEADAGPTLPFPEHAQALQSEIQTVIGQARARFPNLKLVYLSSRIYAGYATSSLNPEPYAYESAFAVKWLIERQIKAAPEMEASKGAFPWLAWGPYLWADGLKPRADGLTWACTELRESDGTHPGPAAREKVARLLLDFLHSDSTARVWYVAPQAVLAPQVGAVVNAAGYGTAVATGSAAVIYGSGLAGSAEEAAGMPLPYELGETRVEVDGVAALLYYVSPGQINFVMPVTGGESLVVFRNQAGSAPFHVEATIWAPGIFTLDSFPEGPAAAQHAGGTTIDKGRPARRGEVIQMYGTGLGFVDPSLKILTPEPVVLVGGEKATVTYAGPAPGLPGVTQVNFEVPASAPSGTPRVVFRLGSVDSNRAVLAVSE